MRKKKITQQSKTYLEKTVASFTVHFLTEDDGGYSVIVPALPGCNTQGDTFEQAEMNARDAIALYIESLQAHGEPIPLEGETVFKRVSVPITHQAV